MDFDLFLESAEEYILFNRIGSNLRKIRDYKYTVRELDTISKLGIKNFKKLHEIDDMYYNLDEEEIMSWKISDFYSLKTLEDYC